MQAVENNIASYAGTAAQDCNFHRYANAFSTVFLVDFENRLFHCATTRSIALEQNQDGVRHIGTQVVRSFATNGPRLLMTSGKEAESCLKEKIFRWMVLRLLTLGRFTKVRMRPS